MRIEHSSLSMELEHWLRTKLQHISFSKVLILGIGNSLKADDGVASFICEKLKTYMPNQVIDASTSPENYIQKIIDFSPRLLLIIDAMDFGGDSGQIHLFPAEQISSAFSSTHALSPQVFARLIQQQCNTEIHYIGIQPQNIALGRPMSLPVEKTAKECVRCFETIYKSQHSDS